MKRLKLEDSGEIKIIGKNDSSEDQLRIPINVIEVTSKPTSLQVTSTERETVTLTWSLPTELNGSNVNEYLVERKTVDGGRWRHACTVTDSRAVVDGLFSGTEYVFRVVAVNGAGQSAPSDTIEATTQAEEEIGEYSLIIFARIFQKISDIYSANKYHVQNFYKTHFFSKLSNVSKSISFFVSKDILQVSINILSFVRTT